MGASSPVNALLLGTAARQDGSEQATYDNWPLYYFAGDSVPGDINGQGVNDVWWTISASGPIVETPPVDPYDY